MEPVQDITKEDAIRELIRRGAIPRSAIRSELKRRGADVPAGLHGFEADPRVDPRLVSAVDALVADVAPGQIAVRDSFRSPEEQAAIRRRREADLAAGRRDSLGAFSPYQPDGSRNPKARHVVWPDTVATAMDLRHVDAEVFASRPDVVKALRERAAEYGLRFPYPNEPWHVELDGDVRSRSASSRSQPSAAREGGAADSAPQATPGASTQTVDGPTSDDQAEVPQDPKTLRERAIGFLAQLNPQELSQLGPSILKALATGTVESVASYIESAPTTLAAIGRATGGQHPGAPPSREAQRDPDTELEKRIGDLSDTVHAELEGESPTRAIADRIRSVAPELSPAEQGMMTVKVARALGSVIGYAPAAALGPAGVAFAGASGAVNETIADARNQDASAEDVANAVGLSALGGTSELVPLNRAFSRLAKIAGPAAGEILKGVAEEFGQEVFQQFVQNIAAKDFDPDRELSEGLGEAGATGGMVGGIVNALLVAAGAPRRARLARAETVDADTAVQDMEAQAEPSSAPAASEQVDLPAAAEETPAVVAIEEPAPIAPLENEPAEGEFGSDDAAQDAYIPTPEVEGGSPPEAAAAPEAARDRPDEAASDRAGGLEPRTSPQESETAEVEASPAEGVRQSDEAQLDEFTRLDRRTVTAVREKLGIPAMTEPARKRWEQSIDNAVQDGRHENVQEIIDRIAENPAHVSDEDRAALLLRETAIEDRIDQLTERAATSTDPVERADALQAMDSQLAELSAVQEASARSATATARSLAFLQAGVSRNQYRKGQILLRAKANKGDKLTGTERKAIEDMTTRLKASDERLAELERDLEARVRALAEQEAQKAIAQTAKRTKRRGSIQARRKEAKDELRALGIEVSLGVNPKAAPALLRLMETHIEEGAVRLPDLIRRVREDVPALEAADVIEVLTTRVGKKRQEKAAKKRLRELRTQAGLVKKIDQALDGVVPTKGKSSAPSSTVHNLRTTLNQLVESLTRSERDQARFEKIMEKAEAVREAIARGEAAKRRSGHIDPAHIQEAKAQLRELRELHRTQDEVADLERRLKEQDFEGLPAERKARRMAGEELQLARAERAQLRARIDAAVRALRPMSKGEAVLSILELPRNFLSSGDVGAIGRQGVWIALNPFRIKHSGRAFRTMMGSLESQEKAEAYYQALIHSPEHAKRRAAGLAIKPLNNVAFRDREDVVRNHLIERLELQAELAGKKPRWFLSRLAGFMRASERNYVTALNDLRAGVFDEWTRRHPEASPEQLKAWARYVNHATGHGPLPPRVGGTLNRFFFSPRLLTSRVATPYTVAEVAWKHPELRKQLAKDVAGFAFGASGAYWLGSLVGDVELDPEDSDFLKIQVGNTRFDPLGGYGQAWRLMARLILKVPDIREPLEERGLVSPGRSYGQPDFYGLWGTFLQYKLHPSITTAVTIMTREDPIGRDMGRGEAMLRSVTPIVLQEAYEGYQEGGLLTALTVFALNEIGIGASTYDDPMRSLDIERVMEHAQVTTIPRAPDYPEDWTTRQKAQGRAIFRDQLAEELRRGNRLERAMQMNPERAKEMITRSGQLARRRTVQTADWRGMLAQ